MKNLTLLAVIASVYLVNSVCFADPIRNDNNFDLDTFVVGGTAALVGEFPSVVSIISPVADHCNGVIVNNNHVITAAGCVVNSTYYIANPFWLRVTAGDLNIVVPTHRRQERNVTHIFVHPEYNPVTQENDIAVLRLNAPYPLPHNTIEPALRRTRIVANNLVCRFGGWGASAANANTTINPVQLGLNVNILDRDTCNALVLINGRVRNGMLCAGQLTAGAGVCNGNRGGAMLCGGELTGILSSNMGCGVANSPGIYTQVRFYNNWINQQFLRTDNPIPVESPILPKLI